MQITTKFKKPLSQAEKICLWLFPLSCVVGWISPNSKYYIIPNMEIYLSFITIFFSFIFGNRLWERKNKKVVGFLLISSAFFFLIETIIHLERPFITTIYFVLFAVSFLILNHKYRQCCCERFINIMSIIFLLGMIEYALAYVGVNFFWGTYERASNPFYQGVFMSINAYYQSIPARFMSICEEPGSVGTIALFGIATIDRVKYKKQYYIFLFAGLRSLSLAFYLLGALYYVFYFRSKDVSLGRIVLAIIAIVSLIFLFGEFINYRITERITSADNIQSLDNRNSDEVDKRFAQYIGTSDALWGLGHRTYYNWKKKTDNVSGHSWIQRIFHKNDGYTCPIVLNPMRKDEGVIDVGKEMQLSKYRLIALLIYAQRHNYSFMILKNFHIYSPPL